MTPGQALHICIKCGTCCEACPKKFGAIQMITGEVPAPIPEEERAIERKSGKGG